jgi:hypothetical protein
MATREIDQQLASMVRVNLADYAEPRVNDNGVLKVLGEFVHPILLQLGHDVLELTGVILEPEEDLKALGAATTHEYTLRNLSTNSPEALLHFDDFDDYADFGACDRYAIHGGAQVMLGLAPDANSQLRLSASVSQRHAELGVRRIKDTLLLLHFLDLGSENGTSVYLSQEDAEETDRRSPHRTIQFVPGVGPKFVTDIEQRWLGRTRNLDD